MRTTVDITDNLYRDLKAKAVHEGKTVKELVLRGVDTVLSDRDSPRIRRLKLPLIDSDQPGSLKIDNQKIYEILDLA